MLTKKTSNTFLGGSSATIMCSFVCHFTRKNVEWPQIIGHDKVAQNINKAPTKL